MTSPLRSPHLSFGGDDELVDDRLRAVAEVAELRFPAHERVAIGDRVAVLEAERRELASTGVVDHERSGRIAEVREARVTRPRWGVVDEHRVALAERAPPRVLTREPHRSCPSRSSEPNASASASDQSTRFSSSSLRRLPMIRTSLGVHLEPGWEGDERVGDPDEAPRAAPGFDAGGRGRERFLAKSERRGCGACDTRVFLERGFEAAAEVFERLLGFF